MVEEIRISDTDQERLLDLSNVLAAYSLGDFTAQAKISKKLDGLDSIISGVNMLGEELKRVAVSRDFLAGVYHSIEDCLFILDAEGFIVDLNDSAKFLFVGGEDPHDKKLSDVIGCPDPDILLFFKDTGSKGAHRGEFRYEHDDGSSRLYEMTLTNIYDRLDNFTSRLVVFKDITMNRETEQLILRSVIDTEEKERVRIAQELHDAVGSELGMLKPILSSVRQSVPSGSDRVHQGLEMCISLVESLMSSVRNSCFEMAPRSILKDGLRPTLRRFKTIMEMGQQMSLDLELEECEVPEEIAIQLYRITQEFVQNTNKHAEADKVKIQMKSSPEGKIHYCLLDNGKGICPETVSLSEGHGLRNMKTRTELIGGQFNLTSEQNKGTKLIIEL